MLSEEAARQGLRIVAFDRPGAGGSSPDPRGTYSSLAADVQALLAHLGLERVVLMGTSGGAERARRRPQKRIPRPVAAQGRAFVAACLW